MYELVIMFFLTKGGLEFNSQKRYANEEACLVAKEFYQDAAIDMVSSLKERYKASFTTCIPLDKRTKKDVLDKIYVENIRSNLIQHSVIE